MSGGRARRSLLSSIWGHLRSFEFECTTRQPPLHHRRFSGLTDAKHAPSRPFSSLVGKRDGGGVQIWEAGMYSRLHQGFVTSNKSITQEFRIFNRRLTTSGSSQGAKAGPGNEAMSKVAGENAKSVRTGPVSWMSLGLLMVTGVGLILLWDLEKKRQLEALRLEKGVIAKQGPGVGKAAIGGPFKLLNQDGKVVTDRDFLGNWNLLYFGFTYCPDICPDELTKLAAAVDKIEAKAGLKVVPVFISIDPERDTVEQVREYLREYHPRFVGLTGTVEDIRQVAREYRVYYMKTEDEGTDYLVDHSIITYLMDPDMNFVKFFGKNYDADNLADGVIAEIKSSSKGK